MAKQAISAFQMEQAMSVLLSARARMQEDPELATDDVLISAILESDPETCDAFELLHKVARAALYAEDMAAAAKTRAAEISARAKRFEVREQMLRGVMFAAMEALGNIPVHQPDFDASIANGRASVVITNIDKLPAQYVETEKTAKKREIGEALKAGTAVEGAELSNPMPVLRLKRA